MFRVAAILVSLLTLGACSSVRESSPQRTATEQLLISTAVDRAVDKLKLRIPQGTKVFVDPSFIETSADGKYAVSAVKDRILTQGAAVAADKEKAEAIVEVRIGALSIDEKQVLVGTPERSVPIPLAGEIGLPEIALYKTKERIGVAKIAATSFGVTDGRLIDSSGPQFGYSHESERVVLLSIFWRTSDLPEEQNSTVFGGR